jgi:hypothetical protein
VPAVQAADRLKVAEHGQLLGCPPAGLQARRIRSDLQLLDLTDVRLNLLRQRLGSPRRLQMHQQPYQLAVGQRVGRRIRGQHRPPEVRHVRGCDLAADERQLNDAQRVAELGLGGRACGRLVGLSPFSEQRFASGQNQFGPRPGGRRGEQARGALQERPRARRCEHLVLPLGGRNPLQRASGCISHKPIRIGQQRDQLADGRRVAAVHHRLARHAADPRLRIAEHRRQRPCERRLILHPHQPGRLHPHRRIAVPRQVHK